MPKNSALRPGLPPSVERYLVGTGSGKSRKFVPGSNVIVARGNSFFNPSSAVVAREGMPL